MSETEYRLARRDEQQKITDFMDANWGSPHPLLHDPRFFSYYYETGEGLNFGLALQDDELLAVCGYTPCNSLGSAVWISLWQAAKKQNGVGLELMSRMGGLCGASLVACNNIRPRTMPLYQFLGYTAAELPQYYRLAPRAPQQFRVAHISHFERPKTDAAVRFLPVESFSELERRLHLPEGLRPYKDLWYLRRRYFDYPGYRYRLYGLRAGDDITALLAVRVNPVGESCVLRVVDYLGAPQDFALAGGTVDALLEQYGAEYADLYCWGLPAETLQAAGFVRRTLPDENILPNYLNPPLEENTDYYFFTSDPENFTMFRADGDQDRPRLE